LQSSDAADVSQDVFKIVLQKIGDFRGLQDEQPRNGGSFRCWLWTLTRNQVRLSIRKQGHEPKAFGGSSAHQRFMEHVADLDEDEPSESLSLRRRIVRRTLELVRGDFSPRTWDAFIRLVFENRSNAEVAAELGISENSIRQAKFRVLRRLREELDGEF
jgi:RNA polymerase sigma-70 factor (ECF subfamily)